MRRAVLVALLAGLVATPVAGAVTHEFVTFGERPVQAVTDERVTIPVEFHQTDTATLRIEGVFAVELRDTDGDGVVRVQVDLGALPDGLASAAVSAESGSVENARTNASATFGPGNYSLVVTPPTGVGDETRLLVGATATPTLPGTTPTPGVTTPAGTTDAGPPDSTGTTDTTGPADAGVTDDTATPAVLGEPTDTTPRLPTILVALFGPAVPVTLLAVAARR